MQRLREQALDLFEIELDTPKLHQLQHYVDLMLGWEANLTAITEPEAIAVKHLLDSMSLLYHIDFLPGSQVADVGTGAGFPGLVLKILRPDLSLTLIESVGKKTAFLSHVVETLKLERVQVVTARAEDVGQDLAHRERYDYVVARAVAYLPTLAEYLLPLCKVGGRAIAMKGGSALNEVADASAAIEVLGGKFSTLHSVALPTIEEPHILVVLDKVKLTPTAFPRRAGLPSKRPIEPEA